MLQSHEDNYQQWLSTEAVNIFKDVEAVTQACREPNEEAEECDDEGALPQSAVDLLDRFTVEQHLQCVDKVFAAGDYKHREMIAQFLLGQDMEVRIQNNIEKAQILLEKAEDKLFSSKAQTSTLSAVEIIMQYVLCHGYLQPSANLQDLAKAQRRLAWFASHESSEQWCPEYARKAVKEAGNALRDVVMLHIVQQQTNLRNVDEFDTLAAEAYGLSRQTYYDEERDRLHLSYHKDDINKITGWTSSNAKSKERRGCSRPPRQSRGEWQSSELRPAFVHNRAPLAEPPRRKMQQPARIKGEPLKIVVRKSPDTPSAACNESASNDADCNEPMKVEVSPDTAERMRWMRFFSWKGDCFA